MSLLCDKCEFRSEFAENFVFHDGKIVCKDCINERFKELE